MSTYVANRIRKPSYFKLAPLTRGRSQRPPFIIGFDSEAESGRPFLFQFAMPDDTVALIDVTLRDPNDGLRQFLAFLDKTCTRKDVEYIVFGFNLQYEYTQLFRGLPDSAKSQGDLEIVANVKSNDRSFRIRALNDKRFTFTVELGNTHRRVKVIDAMAYFPMSLDSASKIIQVGAKLPKPKRFARKHRHEPAFIAYAEQDARLTRKLGEYIMGLHDEYDVQTCISSPHFAARAFRRRFLGAIIPRLESDIEQYGLDSYHGGKNGYYLAEPAELREIYSYDIRSAYPEAMRQLPDVTLGNWSFTTDYMPGIHALYRIVFYDNGCQYHPLQHANNEKVMPGGPYTETFTSYEIDSALAHGDIEIVSILGGWRFDGPQGGPLAEYVDTFYTMKSTAVTDAIRNTAKLFLNSLYGKFFQKTPLGIVGSYDLETGEYIATDPTTEYDYEAGGLYHPALASLITGFVRAKIHGLEHKYRALMTSTDGIFAYDPPDAIDTHSGLGGLDVKRGTLRIWRERLYLFKPEDGSRIKEARHGFRGSIDQLSEIPLKPGAYGYLAVAMVTLRMSTRTFAGKRYEPGMFAELPFTLALGRFEKSP